MSSYIQRADIRKSLLARGKEGLGLVMQSAWPKTQLQVASRDVETDARNPPHDLPLVRRIYVLAGAGMLPRKRGWYCFNASSCEGLSRRILCHTDSMSCEVRRQSCSRKYCLFWL